MLPEPGEGGVKAGFHGADRDLEGGRDVCESHVVDEPQEHNLAVVVAEGVEGRGEPGVPGAGGIGQGVVDVILEGEGSDPPAASP